MGEDMEKTVTITDEYVKSREHRLYKRLRRAYDRWQNATRKYRKRKTALNEMRLKAARTAFCLASFQYEETRSGAPEKELARRWA